MNGTLLDIASPTYRRRLVRELNKMIRRGESVYGVDHPWNHRVVSAHFAIQGGVSCVCADKVHRRFSVDAFLDAYGKQIVASRYGF